MASNVTVDNAELTDYTVSSDEAGSGQVQRVKLTYSAIGSDTHVTADANGLKIQGQVSLASSQLNVSQAGSVNVIQGTSPWLVSQASSITVTPGSTVNVNVASHTDSHTFNFNLASQSNGVVSIDLASYSNSKTVNFNLASQSNGVVSIDLASYSNTKTVNVNVASHSESGTWNQNMASYGGAATTLGQKAMASSVPVVLASDESTVNVNLASNSTSVTSNVNVASIAGSAASPVTAKGTQATNFLGTQDPKDAGRAQVMLAWEDQQGTNDAESALANFTNGSLNTASLAASTSYAVSAGKTLRIQSVNIGLRAQSTAEGYLRARIRQAASNPTNASTIIFDAFAGIPSSAVAANEGMFVSIPIPDGLEVAATQKLTATWRTSNFSHGVSISLMGYEY